MPVEVTTITSSIFQVKNMEIFERFCRMWEVEAIVIDKEANKVRFESVYNGLGLPLEYYDDAIDDYVSADFLYALSEVLADNEMVVVQAVATNKWESEVVMVAVDSNGQIQGLSPDTICDVVKRAGGLVAVENQSSPSEQTEGDEQPGF